MTDMNIFLVEDNDVDAEIFRRGLRKINATGTLVRAKDGVEALDMLRRNSFDQSLPHPYMIVLDINMPRMNGLEFLSALRDADGLSDARVVVFTTSDSQVDIRDAYRNNACGYVVKPTNTLEMQNILSTISAFWSICESPLPAASLH